MSLIKKSPLVAASILATTMFSSGAFASTTTDYEGAVNISTALVSTGCSLDSSSDVDVNFGTLNTGNRAVGDVVGSQPLTINLKCPAASRGTVTTKFIGSTMSDTDGSITPGPGSSGSGVKFQIIGSKGVVDGNQDSIAITYDLSSNAEIEQKYYVDAVMTSDTATPGSEHAIINFEVDNT